MFSNFQYNSEIVFIFYVNRDKLYDLLYNDRDSTGDYSFILPNTQKEIRLHKIILNENVVFKTILLSKESSHQDFWEIEPRYTEEDIDFIVKMLYKQNFEFEFYKYFDTFEYISKKFEFFNDDQINVITEDFLGSLIKVDLKENKFNTNLKLAILNINISSIKKHKKHFGNVKTINLILTKMFELLYEYCKEEDEKSDYIIMKCLYKNIIEWNSTDIGIFKLFINLICLNINHHVYDNKNFNIDYFSPIIVSIEKYLIKN